MNAKDFFDLLESAGCKSSGISPDLYTEAVVHNFSIKYKNQFFNIFYSLDSNSIINATAVTLNQVFSVDSPSYLIKILTNLCKNKGVSIITARVHNRSDLNEEYFKSIEDKGEPAGSFASVDLLNNTQESLNNLYEVVQKAYELFK